MQRINVRSVGVGLALGAAGLMVAYQLIRRVRKPKKSLSSSSTSPAKLTTTVYPIYAVCVVRGDNIQGTVGSGAGGDASERECVCVRCGVL